jgi:ABC-type polysaccharide/polyol phosphate transport system ATPase subunit
MIKIEVKNLVLKYPIKNLNNYLFRAKVINKIKKIFYKDKDIETDKKEKNIKEIKALNNINFTINSNDRLGLIGFNGSGKSTLLRCLSNILPIEQGSISIEGADYLPIIQPYAMCEPDDSLYNNIFLIAQLFGFNKDKIKKQINEILEFAELTEYKDRSLSTLSTGMKFKFVFSISFVLEGKKIFFIDEFFTTGDEKFQNKGFDFIKKKNDQIIVMCSHSRKIIEKFCNKILILDKGEQIYFGDALEGLDRYKHNIKNLKFKI